MVIVWDSPEAGGDRPIAFVVDGKITATVRSTLARIDELCGR